MRKLKKIVHKLVQPRHFFKGPVPIQKSDRSCICVLEISILSLFMQFLLVRLWNCYDRELFLVSLFNLITIIPSTFYFTNQYG